MANNNESSDNKVKKSTSCGHFKENSLEKAKIDSILDEDDGSTHKYCSFICF